MKKTILSFILLLALTKVNIANTVPPEKAKAVATSFLNSIQSNNVSKSAVLELKLVYTDNLYLSKAAEPAYYIFTKPSGHGFVIIAGDDAVTPVIGYSNENGIDANNLPPSFVEFMKGHEERIKYVKSHHTAATDKIKKEWENPITPGGRAVYPVVASLTKAKWDQGIPYNGKCPSNANGQALTGCVATAMGQIMYYWMYPTTGLGTYSYTPIDYPTQSVNFGNTAYGWGYMRDTYTASNTQTEKDAVATLLYHCGVSVAMGYSVTGSGAVTASAAKAYVDHFRYLNTTAYKVATDYTPSAWLALLKGELDQFRPMQMRGGGHSWVCDGYDSGNAFSMNWGWSGGGNGNTGNAYVTLPATETNFPGQAVILGIESPNRHVLSSIVASKTSVCSANQNFTCSVTKQSYFQSYIWTAPVGWKVNGIVSTGEPIALTNSVTITTPSTFNPTGGSISIKASGKAYSGERTLTKSIAIGTGIPTFTYSGLKEYGTSEYDFQATPGAIIQYSANGTTWTNASNMYSVFVAFPTIKTIYIRASNSCGVSGSIKYVLSSYSPKAGIAKMVSQTEEIEPFELAMYPNPASDKVFIQAEGSIQSIKCFNASGQAVDVKLSDKSFSVSHLQKGVYFLSITTENGSTVSKKFVKE